MKKAATPLADTQELEEILEIAQMETPTTEKTTFTLDILGRYLCNTLAEAIQSGPFDVIIIGGGTFGLALAQDVYFRAKSFCPTDLKPFNFRTLVLEAGPLTLTEHVQNIPSLGLYEPNCTNGECPTTRQQLLAEGRVEKPLKEVWGLPWNSDIPFIGLAYCLGGRSLYWGGWSPQFLDSEMPLSPVGQIQNVWPETVVQDLKARFFKEAQDEIGVSHSNEFINGELHDCLRQMLYENYSQIPDAIPLNQLPQYLTNLDPKMRAQMDTLPYPGFTESTKLDAPYAVQTATRPGFFPFNKFSTMPLAIAAVRDAAMCSGFENDPFKGLMMVPNCHVNRLITRDLPVATESIGSVSTKTTLKEVIGIETSQGYIDLTEPIQNNTNRKPVVVLAMGAIESTRMALVNFTGIPNYHLIGRNLMAHVRTSINFVVDRSLFPKLDCKDLEVSALQVQCQHVFPDGTPMHFHLQVTASAVPAGAGGGAADSLLFQKIPDLDNFDRFSDVPNTQIAFAIRGCSEIVPFNSQSFVALSQPIDPDEYLVPRAFATIKQAPIDNALTAVMNDVTRKVGKIFLGEPLTGSISEDTMGSTFHESGSLWMGEDPSSSVTNPDGQFHYVPNVYVADMSVLPTIGSANPMQPGIALQRRLAKRLVPEGDGISVGSKRHMIKPFFQPPMPATPPTPGTVISLFDGHSLKGWRMAGRGSFHVVDGALQSLPSFEMGLLWSTVPMPKNYRLELKFYIPLFYINTGVFVRFQNPESSGYFNPAWYAAETGFEIQIDNTGAPDGDSKHQTGVIYSVDYDTLAGDVINPKPAEVFHWNQYTIEVQEDTFTIYLNGVMTAQYTNRTQPNRGQFSPTEPTFIGLQSYSNADFVAAFKDIQITVL